MKFPSDHSIHNDSTGKYLQGFTVKAEGSDLTFTKEVGGEK